MKARNFYIVNDYSQLNLCPFLAQSVLIHRGKHDRKQTPAVKLARAGMKGEHRAENERAIPGTPFQDETQHLYRGREGRPG
jgi:hypothetical protein